MLRHLKRHKGLVEMEMIKFETALYKIGTWTVLSLPEEVSQKLPSRGIVFVKGTINNYPFSTVLEPDGKGGHWFRIDSTLSRGAKAMSGDKVGVVMKPCKEWPEPDVPADFKKALAGNRKANETWTLASPMAHWAWIRWIRSTSQRETRQRRIMAACNKLGKGERRPCCFNAAMCTEAAVSHSGILSAPELTRNIR